MRLFRVISKTIWDQTQQLGYVPRCGNDHKLDCVHLNVEEAVLFIANKYFVYAEAPLVLEIDDALFNDRIEWLPPSDEQPWLQPRAHIDNLPQAAIITATPLGYRDRLFGWKNEEQ